LASPENELVTKGKKKLLESGSSSLDLAPVLKRLDEIEAKIPKMPPPPQVNSSPLKNATAGSSSNNETSKLRIFKCRGKDCGFATDELDVFIDHIVEEKLKAREAAPAPEAETPKRHRTAKEWLDCPECYPKFEKVFFEHPKILEALKARGYVKTEKKEGLTL